VGLDDVRGADGRAHGPAHENVVDEDEVRRQPLAHRFGVRDDPRVELLARGVLDALHLVAVVLVDDEDRQEAADLGPDRLGASEVEPPRVRLLGEDGDVVALAAPLARELARVDVGARPSEEVAVPHEDAHQRTA
jgi:hypothetical protein